MRDVVLTRNKKKQGLAIIITLMVLSLLLALISAFLTVNRAGNKFTLGSLERRQAQDAALTAFSYAWFELEADKEWAIDSKPLSGNKRYPITNPIVNMDLSQSGDTGVVTGQFSPSGNFSDPVGTFEMRVRNNLAGRDALPGAQLIVPARTVSITVQVDVGGISRNLDALLRRKPQSHESLASGGNINLDDASGLVRVGSEDPYVNRIAANGSLNLPFNDDFKFLKHGEAASGVSLNLGGTDLASASDAAVKAAGDLSGGTFSPKVPSLEVTEFDGDKLALPANKVDIPGGTWTFGEIDRYEYKEADIHYSEDGGKDKDGNDLPDKEGKVKRHQKRSSLYNVLTSPSGQRWAAGTAIPNSSSDWDPPDEAVPTAADPLGSEGAAESWGFDGGAGGFGDDEVALPTGDVHAIAPGLKANVVTAQFAVRSGYKLVSNGDFIVVGEGDRSPELYFGYNITNGGVAEQESLNGGLEAAQLDPSAYMGALIADGDLNVTGGVLGYGSMIAGGDLTIKASSGLRTAPGLGVVVKAENIIINAATEPEPALPGEEIDIDHTVFREAIQAESGGDWTQYNNWLDHQAGTRDSIVQSLGGQSAGAAAASPGTLWGTFNTEIKGGGAMPALSGWPPGQLTIEHYIRLKEFYQTVSTGYNGGDGDPRWLDLSDRQDDVEGRIAGVLDGAAYWAKSYKKTFQEFLTSPDPGLPDMFMEGLIYAEQDITINATDKSLKIRGAMVSKNGNININGATNVDLLYDRTLIDDLYDGSAFATSSLEKAFFVID
jgi:hypothetical protein